jgi:hypothetical protein
MVLPLIFDLGATLLGEWKWVRYSGQGERIQKIPIKKFGGF